MKCTCTWAFEFLIICMTTPPCFIPLWLSNGSVGLFVSIVDPIWFGHWSCIWWTSSHIVLKIWVHINQSLGLGVCEVSTTLSPSALILTIFEEMFSSSSSIKISISWFVALYIGIWHTSIWHGTNCISCNIWVASSCHIFCVLFGSTTTSKAWWHLLVDLCTDFNSLLNESLISELLVDSVKHFWMASLLLVNLVSKLHVVFVIVEHTVLISTVVLFVDLDQFILIIVFIIIFFFTINIGLNVLLIMSVLIRGYISCEVKFWSN